MEEREHERVTKGRKGANEQGYESEKTDECALSLCLKLCLSLQQCWVLFSLLSYLIEDGTCIWSIRRIIGE